MAKNKRSPDQVKKDRVEIADRYLKGETQESIAKALGLTQQQVSYDLQVIRRIWVENQLSSFNDRVSLQLAKIDKAEAEYWRAWEATKGEEEIQTHESGITPKGEIDKTIIRRRKIHGTSAYLDGVLKCIDQRSKLLQVDTHAAIATVIRLGYEVVNPMTGQSLKIDELPLTEQTQNFE